MALAKDVSIQKTPFEQGSDSTAESFGCCAEEQREERKIDQYYREWQTLPAFCHLLFCSMTRRMKEFIEPALNQQYKFVLPQIESQTSYSVMMWQRSSRILQKQKTVGTKMRGSQFVSKKSRFNSSFKGRFRNERTTPFRKAQGKQHFYDQRSFYSTQSRKTKRDRGESKSNRTAGLQFCMPKQVDISQHSQ